MAAGEIVQYEAPLEGVITEECGATEEACQCALKPHVDGRHACRCGGSWEWLDGEFIVHSLPELPPLLGGLLGMPLSFLGAAPFRTPTRPAGRCYRIPAGMIHVKPGCRC